MGWGKLASPGEEQCRTDADGTGGSCSRVLHFHRRCWLSVWPSAVGSYSVLLADHQQLAAPAFFVVVPSCSFRGGRGWWGWWRAFRQAGRAAVRLPKEDLRLLPVCEPAAIHRSDLVAVH